MEATVGYSQGQPIVYSVVYEGSYKGTVYRSTNRGGNWTNIFTDHAFRAVRTEPDNPNVIYAGGELGTGVWKSTNGGASWEPKNSGITDLDISTVVIAPSNSNVVYAGGGRLYNPGRLYRSVDAGEHWSDIYPPLPYQFAHFNDIAVHPTIENVVFAASEAAVTNVRGIWKSTDGGESWRQVFDSRSVYCLAISSSDPDVMYAAFDYFVFKSTDAGENWGAIAELPYPIPDYQIWSIATHPTDPQVVYLSRSAVGIWVSTDGGYTWQAKNVGVWDKNMHRTRLTWDAAAPQWIYSGSIDAGFYRSQDAGEHWEQSCVGLPVRSLVRIAAGGGDGHMWTRAAGGCTDVSTDGGGSWATTSPMLASPWCELLAPSPNNIVISYGLALVEGQEQVEFYVYRSTNGGYTWWNTCHKEGELCDLAYAPSNPDRMYGVMQAAYPFILRSDNGGASWSTVCQAMFPLRTIAVSPTSPDVAYIGCGNGAFLRSENGGLNVSLVGSLPDTVTCIAVDPRSDDVVYAGTPLGLCKSTDGGANWANASAGIVHTNIRDLVLDPTQPSRLWTATKGLDDQGHVYATFDGAQSWIETSEGLPSGASVGDLFVSSAENCVYAATSAGAYTLDTRCLESTVPEATYPNWGRKLAREPNTDNYHIVYTSGDTALYSQSTDEGETWSVAEPIGLGKYPAVILNQSPLVPWVVYLTPEGSIMRARRMGPGVWDQAVVWPGSVQARAGAPSLASDVIGIDDGVAQVVFPVYNGDPPVENYVYYCSFMAQGVLQTVRLDSAGTTFCYGASIALTPGNITHVGWIRGQRVFYRQCQNSVWSYSVPISTPSLPFITEPAANPSLESYGDYVYCVWRGPNDVGDFPGDIWQRSHWLGDTSVSVWATPVNQSQTPNRESNYPVMTTSFATVWQENAVLEGYPDIWGRFALDLGPRPFFESPLPSRYPHVDGHWGLGTGQFVCNTVWTEMLDQVLPLYEVKSGVRIWYPALGKDLGPGPHDGYEPGLYYAAELGLPEQSPYCLSRGGYARLGSWAVDTSGKVLAYQLPYLDPRRIYKLRAVVYHEGKETWSAAMRCDSGAWSLVKSLPGVPDTVWLRVPRPSYKQDARIVLELARVTGDFASLAELKLFQIEDRAREAEGAQSAGAADMYVTRLRSCTPNPFARTTAVNYEIAHAGPVALSVHDVSGRLVRRLESGPCQRGIHVVRWDGTDGRGRIVPAGVYFVCLSAGGEVSTGRLTLVR